MLRSSRHSLKFANENKRVQIGEFCAKYRTMVQKYINILWHNYRDNPPSFLESEVCNLINTGVEGDSRLRQCAAKQACAMVKAVVVKQNKRKYMLEKLRKEGKCIKYLQSKIDRTNFSRPSAAKINVELDSRFVDFEEGEKGAHFDLFVRIFQASNEIDVNVPIKLTKVSKKWNVEGKMAKSIRLNEKEIVLYFEVSKKEIAGTRKVGADQGQVTCLTLSDGQVTVKDKDGYDLNRIQDILSRRKKGSKSFRKAQAHRKNYINWSLNRLNFAGIKELRLEKIVNIRKNKRNSRKSSHWTYPLIRNKLVMLAEVKGFAFVEQDNKFRSQRCSQCGWTHKSNRLGKSFRCSNASCGHYADSDLNAALNHETDLPEVPVWVWNEHVNRTSGFFWNASGVSRGSGAYSP